MENASEPEAPRMSIQTKDLIRYTNHTIHQKKNHAKPIQKFHHNSTHSQSTTKRLDTLPADNEAPRHTPSRQRSTSTHSQPTTKRLDTLPADSEAPRPTPFPSNPKETQPFLHAVQRSADGSSNSRETTQPHTLNRTPTPPLYPHALNLTARTATSTSRLEKPAGKASVQQLRIPDSIPGTGVRSPPPPSSHEKKNLL